MIGMIESNASITTIAPRYKIFLYTWAPCSSHGAAGMLWFIIVNQFINYIPNFLLRCYSQIAWPQPISDPKSDAEQIYIACSLQSGKLHLTIFFFFLLFIAEEKVSYLAVSKPDLAVISPV